MNKDTAIVFCATFVGLIISIITFNVLVQSNILPTRTASLADLDVQPEVASASTTNEAVLTSSEQTQAHSTELASIVYKALAGSKGTYGIAIKNLKTGESYSTN